jgi:hypothetical protein
MEKRESLLGNFQDLWLPAIYRSIPFSDFGDTFNCKSDIAPSNSFSAPSIVTASSHILNIAGLPFNRFNLYQVSAAWPITVVTWKTAIGLATTAFMKYQRQIGAPCFVAAWLRHWRR